VPTMWPSGSVARGRARGERSRPDGPSRIRAISWKIRTGAGDFPRSSRRIGIRWKIRPPCAGFPRSAGGWRRGASGREGDGGSRYRIWKSAVAISAAPVSWRPAPGGQPQPWPTAALPQQKFEPRRWDRRPTRSSPALGRGDLHPRRQAPPLVRLAIGASRCLASVDPYRHAGQRPIGQSEGAASGS
jgi:hypothetical protein